jgi:hypothetical protein
VGAYRDEDAARRERVRAAEERIAELSNQIAPELVAQLRRPLRERYERQRRRLERATDLARREALLDAHEALLRRVVAEVATLRAQLDRLPRRFPARMWLRAAGPDLRHPKQVALRAAVHAALRAEDGEALFHDARPGYADSLEACLVDACFHHASAPLRLQVMMEAVGRSAAFPVFAVRMAMAARVRRSLPGCRLVAAPLPSGMGLPPLERAFTVERGDAGIVGSAAPALVELRLGAERVALRVARGLARIDWALRGEELAAPVVASLAPAWRILASMRDAPR